MDKKQFEIICEKLDKIIAISAIQNIEHSNDKIAFLKKIGLKSGDIALFVGLTESGVRKSEGWKRIK